MITIFTKNNLTRICLIVVSAVIIVVAIIIILRLFTSDEQKAISQSMGVYQVSKPGFLIGSSVHNTYMSEETGAKGSIKLELHKDMYELHYINDKTTTANSDAVGQRRQTYELFSPKYSYVKITDELVKNHITTQGLCLRKLQIFNPDIDIYNGYAIFTNDILSKNDYKAFRNDSDDNAVLYYIDGQYYIAVNRQMHPLEKLS